MAADTSTPAVVPDLSTLPTEDDAAPPTIADTGGQESKVKTILGLLKKLIGVSDVANLRLSLPASLLEPIPNLEYWHYADRPDVFAGIGASPDEFERMLSVMRYSFSKELKFVRYKIGKPYNSTLGEHFRCHWSIHPIHLDPKSKSPIINAYKFDPSTRAPGEELISISAMSTPVMAAADVRDDVSVRSLGSNNGSSSVPPPIQAITSATAPNSVTSSPKQPPLKSSTSRFGGLARKASNMSTKSGKNANAASGEGEVDKLAGGVAGISVSEGGEEVVDVTEQVSHHPPISSAYYACPSRGVEMACVDQISAKVSFPSVQITPGTANQGLFISLSSPSPGAGEEYRITHPIAQVNGIIRGQYYGTISDKVVVSCTSEKPGRRLKTIIEYKDESWLGKPKFALEGVICSYDPEDEDEDEWSRIKHVPSDRVVGQMEGAWRSRIKWRKKGDKEWRTLIEMDDLDLVPKDVRPIEQQGPQESRRLWDPVTDNMLAKNWNEATKQKQIIEQAQRDKAAELKRNGEEHTPAYFLPDISSGKPRLSEAGKKAIEEELSRAKASR